MISGADPDVIIAVICRNWAVAVALQNAWLLTLVCHSPHPSLLVPVFSHEPFYSELR